MRSCSIIQSQSLFGLQGSSACGTTRRLPIWELTGRFQVRNGRLLVQYGIGVRVYRTVEMKKLDSLGCKCRRLLAGHDDFLQ